MKIALVHDVEELRSEPGRLVALLEGMFSGCEVIGLKSKRGGKAILREVEELDIADFDVVITVSGGYAHGVVVNNDTLHINYFYDLLPNVLPRGDKGLLSYFKEKKARHMRSWDLLAAKRADVTVCSSEELRKAVTKYYKVESEKVCVPLVNDIMKVESESLGYFLLASDLAERDEVLGVVKLFNKIGRKLLVIGDGKARRDLELVAGENVDFLSWKEDEVKRKYLADCRGVIAVKSNLGLDILEAFACGKPVLALRSGVAKELIVAGERGEFFEGNTVEEMENALGRLMYNEKYYDSKEISKHAKKFSRSNFKKSLLELLKKGGK